MKGLVLTIVLTAVAAIVLNTATPYAGGQAAGPASIPAGALNVTMTVECAPGLKMPVLEMRPIAVLLGKERFKPDDAEGLTNQLKVAKLVASQQNKHVALRISACGLFNVAEVQSLIFTALNAGIPDITLVATPYESAKEAASTQPAAVEARLCVATPADDPRGPKTVGITIRLVPEASRLTAKPEDSYAYEIRGLNLELRRLEDLSAQVAQRAEKIGKSAPELLATVQPGEGVNWFTLVQTMDAASKAGFERVCMLPAESSKTAATGPAGPKTSFFGVGGNASNVVFVIDRSGSMLDTFDYVRREMLNTIARLKPTQDFHVIFFAAGNPQENPPQKLVPAKPDDTMATAEFLQKIRPEGQTDPLPALKRAFEVLDKADAKKEGKIIYLLTDRVFPDNDAVFKLLAKLNPKKEVLIYTYLYDDKSADAVKVLQKIAEDSGGKFKQVKSDE